MTRIAVLFCLFCSGAAVAKDYTPEQLNRMIDTGDYPPEAAATERQERMDFRKCVRRIRSTVESVRPYPVETVVDREIERGTVRRRSVSRTTRHRMTVKMWTRDTAVTMTCSEANKMLTVSEAPYR